MSDENFANAPLTINELRAEKDGSSAKWTLRDALISALRDIDSGKVNAIRGVIVLSAAGEDGRHNETRFYSATSSVIEAYGLMMRATQMMGRDLT